MQPLLLLRIFAINGLSFHMMLHSKKKKFSNYEKLTKRYYLIKNTPDFYLSFF